MDIASEFNSEKRLIKRPLAKKRHRLSKQLQKALDSMAKTVEMQTPVPVEQAEKETPPVYLLKPSQCQVFNPAIMLVICDTCYWQIQFENHVVEFLGG